MCQLAKLLFSRPQKKKRDIRQFPVQQQQQIKLNKNTPSNTLKMISTRSTTLRFPQQVNHSPPAGQRFPINCQLAKKNLNYSIKSTHDCCCRSPAMAMSRSNVAPRRILKEFPTIKKQFVSFPNNDRQTCKSLANVEYGNCQKNEARMVRTDVDVVPTPATTQTPTMTQMSHNMSTKIDVDSLRTVETVQNDDVSFDVHDVHKATCDNELNAHEQTLNLNVEATEGVGERKEIEHQQAENFNDAFGRQHNNDNNNNNEGENKGKGEGDDVDNDAMNATSIYAKNKHEICEQSKLETTMATHNELNMTKEQQSICLASEQIQRQTIEKPTAAAATVAAATAAASNRQQRISDARGSSSEQVDDQQRQQINDCQLVKSEASTIVTQTETESSLSSSSSSSGHPSIEFLKCAVRDLLDEGANTFLLVDHELFDLLSELVQLIATPINTGNFWGEPLIEQVASECVDMTVSKVSDESETTAVVVDIYSEQIEQPIELDDNNNSSNNDNSTSNSNNNQSSCVCELS